MAMDITNQRFGRLVALNVVDASARYSKTKWRCHCDCGKEKDISIKGLRAGTSRSCGCLNNEMLADLNRREKTTHGQSGYNKTPEYAAWKSMKERCLKPKTKNYSCYGGRGIKIHPEWIHSFESFFSYMGRKPTTKHTLGRIENDGNYEPGNVRWETGIQQANNTRRNTFLEVNGERRTVSEWARTAGLPRYLIQARLGYGWSHERAVLTPWDKRPRKRQG